uniref:Callose synthase helical domain-containing protein n=2 Tax=Lactuca sativa TaxID=4236 RepID=A0A9R1UP77_LACSA|nr:hypothetical protein LSAT_V11C800400080 [Lactuca sativa]
MTCLGKILHFCPQVLTFDVEMELLQMPKNTGTVPMVQWPLFLLVNKLFLAKDIAGESDTQDELWDRISRDDYMQYAVEECFYTIKLILTLIFDKEGNEWVERIYDDIKASIVQRTIHFDFQLKKLSLVMQKVTALTGILKEGGSPESLNSQRDHINFKTSKGNRTYQRDHINFKTSKGNRTYQRDHPLNMKENWGKPKCFGYWCS